MAAEILRPARACPQARRSQSARGAASFCATCSLTPAQPPVPAVTPSADRARMGSSIRPRARRQRRRRREISVLLLLLVRHPGLPQQRPARQPVRERAVGHREELRRPLDALVAEMERDDPTRRHSISCRELAAFCSIHSQSAGASHPPPNAEMASWAYASMMRLSSRTRLDKGQPLRKVTTESRSNPGSGTRLER
jgi:hypothetical protein